MKLEAIIHALEAWAPPALQESYDNSGLIAGQKHMEITGCMVSLDVTEAVIDEAIALGCNLVIAHHPLLFSGIKKLTGSDWVQRTLIKAIKNDIALYALHTNLDNVQWGVNQKIASILGLKNLRVLDPKPNTLIQMSVFAPHSAAAQVKEAMWAAGAGQIGDYKDCAFTSGGLGFFRPTGEAQPTIGTIEGHSEVAEQKIEVIFPKWKMNEVLQAARSSHVYEEMAYYATELKNLNPEFGSGMIGEWDSPLPLKQALQLIKDQFGGIIRHTADLGGTISKVALCGGSGSFLLGNAIAQKADLFLTADFKYHQFFDADNKIVIADIGHFEIEQFTSQLIVDHLRQKFTTFALRISTVNTNPVGYY
jgi:dinuclear metal center YbgI/SA1388 family protein